MTLEIIYRDEHLIAINKPHGLLVHRSNIARDATRFAIQELRNQVEQHVHPVHRLDRKTSGVLLFALDKDTLRDLQSLFRDRLVEKNYHAIVRGFLPEEGVIDYALKTDRGVQQAVTRYESVQHFEIPIPSARPPTQRYSLCNVLPQTGRQHQIRRHFKHIFHPIIGDRPYGCNKQNRFWKETFSLHDMMLHARSLNFSWKDRQIKIEAKPSSEFRRVLNILQNHKISSE